MAYRPPNKPAGDKPHPAGCICGKCQAQAARARSVSRKDESFPIILAIAGLVALLFLVWAIAWSTPGRSQSGQCLPMETALQVLRENAGEQARYQATLSNGRELLVTIAPSGSWSLLALLPDDGAACVVAVGHQWRDASL